MRLLRLVPLAGMLLASCQPKQPPEMARKLQANSEGPRIFSRDTRRLAKRHTLTWLSVEPLANWQETPLTLRLASDKQINRYDAALLAQNILKGMLWITNKQQEVRIFANQSLERPEWMAIDWNDLALKISFWNSCGERFPPPAISQLIVRKGMLTTWLADYASQKLQDQITQPLAKPADAVITP